MIMTKSYSAELEARIKAWSREQQSPKRFRHTESVVETVTSLAERWAPQEILACRIAAWIHDSAKKYDDATLLEMAENQDLPITKFERENPMLLHGIVAYSMAAEKFDVDDDRLRTACAYHTSGAAEMTLFDKLVFLADKIEPGRDFPSVEQIREAARQDIDWAVWLFVEGNIRYLIGRMKTIDPRAIELYNDLLPTMKTR